LKINHSENLFGGKTVSKQKLITKNIDSLIDMLASKNSTIRRNARKSLVALGKPAVPSLNRTLQKSKINHVRWEAAKTLGAISDARAIPSLLKALEDSDIDVIWLAAEGLRKFKKAAWSKLLRALIKSGEDSVLLRHGVHHVLKNQKEDGFNDLLKALNKALESNSAQETTTIAAYDILKRLKAKS
jgi:HEAT repeat protein